MKKIIQAAACLALFPLSGMGQSSFNGTWKVEVDKAQMPKKPDVYVLQNGNYECKTCVPPVNVKADGQDHKLTGDPYYDTINVKVVDDRTIEITDKKNGKTVGTSKSTVSPDGNTLDFEFSDSTASNGQTITGKGHSTRVAKGPAGSHAISGSWRITKFDNVSDNGLVFTYKVDGDNVTMTNPAGQSYTAKLDGPEAPYKGDPGITTISVKRLGASAIEETDKRNGKTVSVAKLTVGADGKTMTIAVNDILHGTTSQFTAQKQ